MARRAVSAAGRLIGGRVAFDWRNPMSWLRLVSVRRGLLGGSGGWMFVAVLVWAPRVVARLAGRRNELVATESLRPGQSLSIDTSAPRGRRTRRR